MDAAPRRGSSPGPCVTPLSPEVPPEGPGPGSSPCPWPHHGCSSRPAPLHAGNAAPIATPHGGATLSVPSKPPPATSHAVPPRRSRLQARRQGSGAWQSPWVQRLAAVPQFPSVTLRHFCSSLLPLPASTSPNVAARSFLCHQHSSSGPSRARIWATSPAGDTSFDTTGTRHASRSATPSTAARSKHHLQDPTKTSVPSPGHWAGKHLGEQKRFSPSPPGLWPIWHSIVPQPTLHPPPAPQTSPKLAPCPAGWQSMTLGRCWW